ncbi:hypothetical protein DAPPUDRAFT_322535 [Daphnia pulex]|uniref:DDE-1 domain-containing protein n=1 Tax=Daphnia pulex TaxID=6669 RepID=E9GWB2_DAPPU|nr:hypothetical protein DAPPUDRAFT_322535 [Daphnia pulex]|eukprot:EFX76077.1 hypothetical protein DAPPUDRAFT_322535 [Daphnia pulex]
MPARTYLAYNESRKTVRGTKSLKAKYRFTLVLCVNVDGSCKIEPLIVGKAAKPHCFRDSPCPVPYIHKKMLGLIRLSTDTGDSTGQVSIFFFPPNSTSVHQPLDQGIISAVKINYTNLMLSKFIEAYEDIERMQQLANQAKKEEKVSI